MHQFRQNRKNTQTKTTWEMDAEKEAKRQYFKGQNRNNLSFIFLQNIRPCVVQKFQTSCAVSAKFP